MKFIQTILTQFKLITDTNHFIQGPKRQQENYFSQPSRSNQLSQTTSSINLHTLINNHLNNRTNFSS